MFLSARAGASANGLELDYRASPPCPDLQAFAAEVEARLSPAAKAEASRFRFKIEIQSADGGYRGALSMLAPEQTGVIREVTNVDCNELGGALAFIVALIMNPPDPADTPAQAPSQNEPAAQAERAVPNPAPTLVAPKPAANRRAPSEPGFREVQRWSGRLTGALDLATARAPSVSLDPRVGAALRYEPPSAIGTEAGLSAAVGSSSLLHETTGDATLRWLLLRAEGCALAHPRRQLLLSGCAVAEVGQLTARGERSPSHTSRSALWLAPGLAVRPAWQPLSGLELFAEASLFLPLVRPTFYFTGQNGRETVHSVPNLGVSWGIGASVRFR
jgi:hypothetical protein